MPSTFRKVPESPIIPRLLPPPQRRHTSALLTAFSQRPESTFLPSQPKLHTWLLQAQGGQDLSQGCDGSAAPDAGEFPSLGQTHQELEMSMRLGSQLHRA